MGSGPWGDLFGQPDFVKLWLGQTVSQFGSQITLLALPLVAAVLLDATPWEMGLLSAASLAPFLLIGLPAGVWVDRWPRRPVLIVADLGRAIALMLVPLSFLADALSLNQLYAISFVTGVLTVFGSPRGTGNAVGLLIVSGVITGAGIAVYNITQVSLRQALCPPRC